MTRMSRIVRLPRNARRGFALLAVLWVIAGASAIGLVLMGTSRLSLQTMGNRVALRRAAWRAEGCLESAMSRIGTELQGDREGADAAWVAFDSLLVAEDVAIAGCTLHITPAGVALSLHDAQVEQLRALFCLAGAPPAVADSLADALADWRDTDNVARPAGAERAWYANAGRVAPRNGPLANVAELAYVRGFDRWPGVAVLLSAERGRVLVGRAPDVVIAAAAGVPDSAVRALRLRVGRPLRTADLAAVAQRQRPDKSACSLAGIASAGSLTDVPDAWVLTAQVGSGSPPVRETVEYLVARSGPRAALVRRRSWP